VRARRWWLAPAAIVGTAIVVRLIGVGHALPYVYHPDEPVNYGVFHAMVTNRTLNPEFFHYPSLFFDLQALAHAGYIGVGKLAGWFSGSGALPAPVMQTGGNGSMANDGALLAARLVTVGLGVGVVVAGMSLSWTISRRRAPFLIAGGLLAIHPLLVEHARLVTPDTLAALIATLALAAAVVVGRNPQPRAYLVAGGAIGLATAAKYNVALVAIALVVAHFIAAPRASHRWLLAAAGVAVAAFLVTTPFVLFDAGRFWADMYSEVVHYSTEHPGNEGGAGGANLVWLWGSTGPLVVAAFGIGWLEPRVRRLSLIPASFVAVYLVLLSAQSVRFERNLLPMLPALLVLDALVACEVWNRVRVSNRAVRLAIVAGAALLVMWPTALTALDTRDALSDERADARAWIARNVPAGSTVVIEAYSPHVDPGEFHVVAFDKALLRRADVERTNPVAVVITEQGSGRYLEGSHPHPAAVSALAWLQSQGCATFRSGSGAQRIQVFRLRCE